MAGRLHRVMLEIAMRGLKNILFSYETVAGTLTNGEHCRSYWGIFAPCLNVNNIQRVTRDTTAQTTQRYTSACLVID